MAFQMSPVLVAHKPFSPEITCKQITNTGKEICVRRFPDSTNYSVHFKNQEKKSSISQCCYLACINPNTKEEDINVI